MRLKITHKLNVEIIEPSIKINEKDDIIDATTSPFVRYNLLTHREYEHHKLNDTISSIPNEQLSIYEIFYKRFLFKGISNIRVPYCEMGASPYDDKVNYEMGASPYDDELDCDEFDCDSGVYPQPILMNQTPTINYQYKYTEYDKHEIQKINEVYNNILKDFEFKKAKNPSLTEQQYSKDFTKNYQLLRGGILESPTTKSKNIFGIETNPDESSITGKKGTEFVDKNPLRSWIQFSAYAGFKDESEKKETISILRTEYSSKDNMFGNLFNNLTILVLLGIIQFL
jgi:hypothetical protein